MAYYIAYGKKENLASAIDNKIIPKSCVIFTEDSQEMLFYDPFGVLRVYQEKYKFHDKAEAEAWITKYDCSGQIISIHENDKCNIYVVDYTNKLRPISAGTMSTSNSAKTGQILRVLEVDEDGKVLKIESIDAPDIDKAVETALTHAKESGDFQGDPGITPHIGENGNWYVGDTDTGISSKGISPHIGENGNWYIGENDTGINARGDAGDPGVHVGDKETMPKGTVLHVNPKGKSTKIPQIDTTLSKSGYAAEVGQKLSEQSVAIGDFENKQNTICPDDFDGSDTEKIQICFDTLAENGGVIVINRTYTLDGNVYVTHSSDALDEIFVKGIGKDAKIEFSEYSFVSAAPSAGGVRFSDLNLHGNGILFDGGNQSIMRVYFSNVFISGFAYVMYSRTYIQSAHFVNCTIRRISQYLMKITDDATGEFAGRGFDIKLCENTIEWSNSIVYIAKFEGASITDNCIEGFYGVPFVLNSSGKGINISGNYFETNGIDTESGTSIDLTGLHEGTSLNISNNFFAQYNKPADIIKLPSLYNDGRICIVGNHSADRWGTLIAVPDDATDLSSIYVFANHGIVRDRNHRLTQRSIEQTNADVSSAPQRIAPASKTQARKNTYSADIGSEFISTASGEEIKISNALDEKLLGMTLYGKSVRTDAPSIETPATIISSGESGDIAVEFRSKNIFGGEVLINAISAINTGVTVDSANGIMTFRSNAWKTERLIFDGFEPQKQYTIVIKGKNSYQAESPGTNLVIRYADGTSKAPHFIGNDVSTIYFVTDKTKTVSQLLGTTYGGTTTLYYHECGIFEGEITESEFAQYSRRAFTLAETGALAGVPSDKAWDYVDENGVGWLCDKVDFYKKVRETKVVCCTFNGSEEWEYLSVPGYPTVELQRLTLSDDVVDGVVLCDTFDATSVNITTLNQDRGIYVSNVSGVSRINVRTGLAEITDLESFKAWLSEHPITILYVKTKPDIVPLSAETMGNYSALRLYTPETEIDTNDNVGISVNYIPDTIAGRMILDIADRLNQQ